MRTCRSDRCVLQRKHRPPNHPAVQFESTQPLDAAPTVRVNDFTRYLDDLMREADGGISRLSSLSPSLMQDLMRFERNGGQTELLEVIAAAVRHGRALTVHLRCDGGTLPLTLFPAHARVHCTVPLAQFLEQRLTAVEVLHVEPAVLQPERADDYENARGEGVTSFYAPLAPLTWELALRGARAELLPEISSLAAYRIPPGVDLRGLESAGTLGEAITRLRRDATNLREMSAWPGFDRERAMRLLNALYLQAGLIISRTHPAATNEGWTP